MLKKGVPEVHQCFPFLHPQPLHDVNNEVADYEIIHLQTVKQILEGEQYIPLYGHRNFTSWHN